MIAKTIHSLEKVFFDRSPEPAEWSADVAARGEEWLQGYVADNV